MGMTVLLFGCILLTAISLGLAYVLAVSTVEPPLENFEPAVMDQSQIVGAKVHEPGKNPA